MPDPTLPWLSFRPAATGGVRYISNELDIWGKSTTQTYDDPQSIPKGIGLHVAGGIAQGSFAARYRRDAYGTTGLDVRAQSFDVPLTGAFSANLRAHAIHYARAPRYVAGEYKDVRETFGVLAPQVEWRAHTGGRVGAFSIAGEVTLGASPIALTGFGAGYSERAHATGSVTWRECRLSGELDQTMFAGYRTGSVQYLPSGLVLDYPSRNAEWACAGTMIARWPKTPRNRRKASMFTTASAWSCRCAFNAKVVALSKCIATPADEPRK